MGLRDEVSVDMDHVRSNEARRRELEHCETGPPSGQTTPACRVTVRYIYQVLRAFPPEQVFAQALLGFETVQQSIASGEPGFVGINFVQPEDGFVSMRDYALQMRMIEYLHSAYPAVHISLHAAASLRLASCRRRDCASTSARPSRLPTPSVSATALMRCMRIMPPRCSREMAEKHVMVEINLSSNEGILGVKGMDHPFPYYRDAHVPVALSTDDEGVSRIDITREYTRAALDYHLTYADLKQLARTGMEHTFLPERAFGAAPDVFTAPATALQGADPRFR